MHPLDEVLIKELQAYFPVEQVDVRVGPTYEDGDEVAGAKPLFYIPARRVQQRLDNVVGPMNWQVSFNEPVNRSQASKAGAEATISILDPFTGEWIEKADVSENTDTEPMKGGYSKAIVRAGVQWGIGRYLYFLPESPWLDAEEKYGRTQFEGDPMDSFPKQYTPDGGDSGSDFTQEQVRQLRQAARGKDRENVKEVFGETDDFQTLLSEIRSL